MSLFALSAQLDALQTGDSLTLATFVLDTLAPSESALSLGDVVLGDAFGVAFASATLPGIDGRSRRLRRRRSHSRR